MKKILKNNWLLIIIFLALLSIFLFNTYKYLSNAHQLEKSSIEASEKCSKNNITEAMLEYCEEVEKAPTYKIDFYSMFYSTYSQGYNFMIFIIFLLITIPSIRIVCPFFKNNILKNTLTRQSYRKVIIKLFAKAYKSALLLPILTIVAFIICFISTGNFDFNNAIEGNFVSWSKDSMQSPFLFMFVYTFKIFIISIIYINICLIICKKNHNFVTATILSYLCFIAIEIFLELVGNTLIFTVILNSGFGIVLNILAIFSLFDYYGLAYSILIPLIFFVITSVIVYFEYKNKEKMLIECEKNA